MRSPVPYIAAAGSLLMASVGVGLGLAILFNVAWIAYAGVAIGLIALVAAVLYYRGCNDGERQRIYLLLCTLWYAEIGIIFGGMPGALLGRRIAGEFGEAIGWCVTAVLSGIVVAIWGRRRERRNAS